jgi:hypothetical protein
MHCERTPQITWADADHVLNSPAVMKLKTLLAENLSSSGKSRHWVSCTRIIRPQSIPFQTVVVHYTRSRRIRDKMTFSSILHGMYTTPVAYYILFHPPPGVLGVSYARGIIPSEDHV